MWWAQLKEDGPPTVQWTCAWKRTLGNNMPLDEWFSCLTWSRLELRNTLLLVCNYLIHTVYHGMEIFMHPKSFVLCSSRFTSYGIFQIMGAFIPLCGHHPIMWTSSQGDKKNKNKKPPTCKYSVFKKTLINL
jgi:hypothetical protein